MEEELPGKDWLFRENIRLKQEAELLEAEWDRLHLQQKELKKQEEILEKRSKMEKTRIDCEKKLIKDKWKALKRGFDELDHDRQVLRAQQESFYQSSSGSGGAVSPADQASVFFSGVFDKMSLKKRYRDMVKIFHPDNLAGDEKTVAEITREYDELKNHFEN